MLERSMNISLKRNSTPSVLPALSISLGPVQIEHYKLIRTKIRTLTINVTLQLGAFFKVGAITSLSMFVMKSYLEAFDRNELSDTQKKERCLKGERSGGERSFREPSVRKIHSRITYPPSTHLPDS